jgi:hypothetical protein
MKAEDILAALHFECIKPNPDNRKERLWLSDKWLPAVQISLPEDPSDMDVLYAIVGAGRNDAFALFREKQEALSRLFRGVDPFIPVLNPAKPIQP